MEPWPRQFSMWIGVILLGAFMAALSAIAQEGGSTQPRPSAQQMQGLDLGLGLAAHGGVSAYALIGYTMPLPVSRLGMRLDLSRGLSSGVWNANRAARDLTVVTANLVCQGMTGPFTPYAVAGVGLYTSPGAGVRAGVNVGAGIRSSLGPVAPFVEMRTHAWRATDGSGATRPLDPLVIGLRF